MITILTPNHSALVQHVHLLYRTSTGDWYGSPWTFASDNGLAQAIDRHQQRGRAVMWRFCDRDDARPAPRRGKVVA